MKYNYFQHLTIVFLLLFVPTLLFAQGDVDAPIDGGLSLLIAAGVGYGVKKAYHHRKQGGK